MRVVITGASGNLGTKATAALADHADAEIVGIDRRTAETPVVIADLTTWGPWVDEFDGADIVVHLAADPRPVASWAEVCRSNVDVSLNVLRAAERARVGRVVFASSNWVLGGYRFRTETLCPDTPPWPVNPYGASKLFIERAGRDLAERTGIGFLALRIGWCQPGKNRPGPHMAFGTWGQQLWLSNADWTQAVLAACVASVEGAHVLNIFSANHGMRWDLTASRERIGFEPTSSHRPVVTPRVRTVDTLARIRAGIMRPGIGELPMGERW